MPVSKITTSSIDALGYGFKNRIINGAMVIDQRNNGGSVTVSSNDTSVFIADRWQVIKNSSATITAQQSTTAPTDYSRSLVVNVTSGSAVGSTNYLICGQRIEGFNFADMLWGTADAKPITISFQVRSSLAGTYAITLANSANNRCFGANYTISAANTWEQKTVTIAGDTTGTWVGATNGNAVSVYFSLGAGASYQGSAGSWQGVSNLLNTSSAQNTFLTAANSFFITGVQLEKGSTATSFDYRPYGTELALCQRYYEIAQFHGWSRSSDNLLLGSGAYVQQKRAAPTVTYSKISGSGSGSVLPLIGANVYYGGCYQSSGAASADCRYQALAEAEL